MKLWEINFEIEKILDGMEVDPETGEIMSEEEALDRLSHLGLEKKEVLESMAKEVLNCRAEWTMLKAEESRLKERRDALKDKESRLISILDRECGEKTNLGVATLSYRKTASTQIEDNKSACDWLTSNGYVECVKVSDPEVRKDEVKKLLKKGIEVPGASIVEGRSVSLK